MVPHVDREDVAIPRSRCSSYRERAPGCGETPYFKLLTPALRRPALIANATGCWSIYGGNLPTTPFTTNPAGAGRRGRTRCSRTTRNSALACASGWTAHPRGAHAGGGDGRAIGRSCLGGTAGRRPVRRSGVIAPARAGRATCGRCSPRSPRPRRGASTRSPDSLVKKTSGSWGATAGPTTSATAVSTTSSRAARNVNILVLDTEVYSNTGGQASKATPRGAVAKFAAGGKATTKKDLGLLANRYGHVYVARVALGADEPRPSRPFSKPRAYPGDVVVIAYSHCIAHGYDMGNSYGATQQKLAVELGRLAALSLRPAASTRMPFQLDSAAAEDPGRGLHGQGEPLLDAHPLEPRARPPSSARRSSTTSTSAGGSTSSSPRSTTISPAARRAR